MAATVSTGVGLPGPVSDLLRRAADPDRFARWEQLVAQTGYCSHPVRLLGRVSAVDRATGEVASVYDSAAEPDGVLLTACGNRRETVCRSCSATYRADTWQLVAAGLRGGKGIPESVSGHPRLFVTLTAPSFGAVHSRRERHGRGVACRPRRRPGRCPHGRALRCLDRHRADDPVLGTPLCAECYDYEGSVLFNAYAPELWRRFTQDVFRQLARRAGLTQRALRESVRVRYAKVAEGQRRGLVHFHAVFRLDAASLDPADVSPPPPGFTAELLADAIRAAGRRVAVHTPSLGEDAPGLTLQFGEQLDVRSLGHGEKWSLRMASRASVGNWMSGRSPLIWPSTSPSPLVAVGCPTGRSHGRTSRSSTAVSTCIGWPQPAGHWACYLSSRIGSCAGGRTCWASEGT